MRERLSKAENAYELARVAEETKEAAVRAEVAGQAAGKGHCNIYKVTSQWPSWCLKSKLKYMMSLSYFMLEYHNLK